MITKRIVFPTIGRGIGFEFGFDLKGWWIDHTDGTGKVRTYLLFGPTIQYCDDGTIWNFHLLFFKLSIAILKK